jgi:cyclophilin family peptidyl-prolyl cis-trans isomerase
MSKNATPTPSVSKRREEALKRKQEEERRRWIIVAATVFGLVVLLGAIWLFSGSEDVPEEAAAPLATESVAGAVESAAGDRPLAAMEPAARNDYFSEAPAMTIDTAKTYDAVIEMADGGTMRLRLFDEEAPITVNSFVFLANQGFFDGVSFHRVLEGFMAQGGDPTGSGSGGPGYEFVNETDNDLTFDRRGLLAMANAGPNTNGSQFFITFDAAPNLNGGYTIFGELTEGDDVLESITRRDPMFNPTEPGDVIKRITIEES